MRMFSASGCLTGLPRILCLVVVSLLSATALWSQVLRLHIAASDETAFRENIRDFRLRPAQTAPGVAEFPLPDTGAVTVLCRDLLQHFRQKSFWVASIDSLRAIPERQMEIPIPDSLKNRLDLRLPSPGREARLYLGPLVRWLRIRSANPEERRLLVAAGFREGRFASETLRHDELLKAEERVLQYAENNGYPLARVWLDSIVMEENGGINAVLRLDRGRFFVLNDLKTVGDVKLPAAYLANYLGVKPGSPYNREQVLHLREQLRSLVFVESTGNPTVTFSSGKPGQEGLATVNLFLKKKKASRFDFVIGLLPRSDNNDGRLLLTGSLSAAFQNALNYGERLSVEFERLKPETQRLDVQAGVPYLFGSPFGAEGRLQIFRRDSTWVDALGDLGVSYLFAGGDYVKLLWENRSSALQKVDTQNVIDTRRLPPNLDYRQNGYGLEVGFNRLDYRFNPRRGWSLQIRSLAGFNTVKRNNQIENLNDPDDPAFDFASLYDTVAERRTRYRLEGRAELYLPLFQRTTFKLGVRGGGIFSEKPVYNNEQYRLGGNKLLRGFDEESLFATRYVVSTAELRLLLGLNSYLAAFADYGYIENLTNAARVFLRPLGLGAGLTFETQAGIFGISLAAGKRDRSEPVDLRALKFHIGYVSLF